jgi:GxxExxY protein
MKVHSKLGPGFLEAVYHEALMKQFDKDNIPYKSKVKLKVFFDGEALKKFYVPDFICYDKIILELKAASFMHQDNVRQTLNYVKASGYKLGVVVNFGESKLKYKRLVN